jgi:hypothetical protein
VLVVTITKYIAIQNRKTAAESFFILGLDVINSKEFFLLMIIKARKIAMKQTVLEARPLGSHFNK